jgi:hypothetical protein
LGANLHTAALYGTGSQSGCQANPFGTLEKIRRWTASEADWDRLLRIHHGIRPKPKGKPTFRLIAQMTSEQGLRMGAVITRARTDVRCCVGGKSVEGAERCANVPKTRVAWHGVFSP